jgi:CDP-glycerol glycerophosphotransferase
VPLHRIPGVRRVPQLVRRVDADVALFESWHGSYSDNPRAIAEELRRRGARVRQVWVLRDDAPERPPDVETVAPGSRRHLEYMGAARWVVTNSNLPGYFHKKRRATYLQTWHGTPLKRIAFDIPAPAFRGSAKYLRNLRDDVAKWDYLVSPNRFSTDVFRRAFRYAGPVLETGYPRNDLLRSPAEAAAVRERLRARLGIPEDARAVLYAPTWRDDVRRFSTELDLGRMADALGDGCFLLLRAHQLVAATVGAQSHPRVRDVSGLPDIRDLYAVADVLVTDYSSVMFDFAVTGRPILLFTYDLASYRDDLRGFYFDLEREAPGPLLSTTDEVIEALRGLDAVAARHAAEYRRFAERFCHLDDGHAAARVVDAVFDGRV